MGHTLPPSLARHSSDPVEEEGECGQHLKWHCHFLLMMAISDTQSERSFLAWCPAPPCLLCRADESSLCAEPSVSREAEITRSPGGLHSLEGVWVSPQWVLLTDVICEKQRLPVSPLPFLTGSQPGGFLPWWLSSWCLDPVFRVKS